MLSYVSHTLGYSSCRLLRSRRLWLKPAAGSAAFKQQQRRRIAAAAPVGGTAAPPAGATDDGRYTGADSAQLPRFYAPELPPAGKQPGSVAQGHTPGTPTHIFDGSAARLKQHKFTRCMCVCKTFLPSRAPQFLCTQHVHVLPWGCAHLPVTMHPHPCTHTRTSARVRTFLARACCSPPMQPAAACSWRLTKRATHRGRCACSRGIP